MFNRRDDQPYAITGTTRPIYVPRDTSPRSVQPGQDYFFVQVHSAQVAFTGPMWERVNRLIVTSQVNLNHPILGSEGLRAIQRSREVKKERAEQLGLTSNLISLVPATMTHVSISIEFILDKGNRLADLSAMINDDSFLAAISLAPGAAMVAKTISGLAEKVIQTFVPADDREPILQFTGDFNLNVGDGLKDGYHVILGTRDEHNPIPDPLPELKVGEGGLQIDGRHVTQLSYVVLDVRHSPARTRARNDNAPWEAKLREAEGEAQMIAGDPYADDTQREQSWEKCRKLLQEARPLLMADPNYLRGEAENIFKSVYKSCVDAIAGGEGERPKAGIVRASRGRWQPDLRTNRALLDIPVGEDLDATIGRYAEQAADAQRVLEAAGI